MEKLKANSLKKNGLHPRNKNNTRYDFELLIKQYPELKQFVFTNKHNRETIDFANPEAIRSLNKVLLMHFYGLSYWEIPKNYLCPPIPGRADYIHHIADLLGSCSDGIIPLGPSVSVLDIGVGANCIYPIIGTREYGWRFVGSEIDITAMESANKIIESNNFPKDSITIRLQKNPNNIFRNIVKTDEQFNVVMCNPPFHSSMEQAEARTNRKWKNLGIKKDVKTVLNFGGQSNELIYAGGEEAFVKNMIQESVEFGKQIFWFTTLVSKQSNLSGFNEHLLKVQPTTIKTIGMAQGQKKSRFVAWTFLTIEEQLVWRKQRWD